jgi:hypothetical protein
MKSPRHSSYPMPAEDAEELARELSEFGYRETDDADEADRRRFYKVEKWDAAEVHVLELVHASNDLSRARAVFAAEAPAARPVHAAPEHPRAGALAAVVNIHWIKAWIFRCLPCRRPLRTQSAPPR